MEHRAAVPPGLPKPDPVNSYWWEPLSDIADCRTTPHLPFSADIVIVGSGISGASIAYHLLSAQPNLNVVLLEARQAASGASGRNGGHTKTASYRSFAENVKLVGAEEAMKIARLEYNCMKAVHAFIAENNIAADSLRCDTVDVFYDEAQWKGAQESVALMRKLMGKNDPAPPHDFYDTAETASNFLCPKSCGSIKYESGSLNAYKLTIAILKMALAKTLNLQCNTPVTSISSTPNHTWTLTTPRGTLTTPKLILATNGYTAHLLPSLQGVIVPFRGVVTAQRPGLNLPQTGFPTTYSMVYATGYEYMITRPANTDFQGDIVIGGGLTKAPQGGEAEYGNTDDTIIQPDIEKYLLECAKLYFGQRNWGIDSPEGRLRKSWTGIMGYSADGYPFVGPVTGQKGLYLSASFQGHGMVLCWLCAKACTQMVLGEDDKDLKTWFPDNYRVSEERLKKRFKGRLKVSGGNEGGREGEREIDGCAAAAGVGGLKVVTNGVNGVR